MIQTIILFVAVFLFIYGITCIVTNIINVIYNDGRTNIVPRIIIATIGLTYILWYCN